MKFICLRCYYRWEESEPHWCPNCNYDIVGFITENVEVKQ